MATREEQFAAYEAFDKADQAMQRELEAAFGRKACDRRYDRDRSAHPPACRAAHERRMQAMLAWEAAMGIGPGASQVTETA